jgi:hypothetical protein
MCDQPQRPALPDRVRHKIRLKNYSVRAEDAYLTVIRSFILYHKKDQEGLRRER